MLLKDIFDWKDPKLFSEQSIIRRSLVFFIVVICNFLIAIESYAVSMSGDLLRGAYAIDYNRRQWTAIIFVMGFAIVPPIFSFFTSRFTPKVYFSIGNLVFMVGSWMGGLSTSYYILLLGRLITGIGSGIVSLSTLYFLKRTTHESKHSFIASLNSNLIGVGVFLGMGIGGMISQTLHWRMAFFLDAVLCIFVFIVTWIIFKEHEAFTPRTPIDWVAYLYYLTFLVCITVFFSQVKSPWNTLGWVSEFSLLFAFLTILFFILLVVRCKRSQNPLFDLKLMENRSFKLLCIAAGLVGFTMYGSIINDIGLLVSEFQYEHVTTGLILATYGIALFMSGVLVFFIKGIKPIVFVLIGILVIGISFFAHHALTIQSQPKDVAGLLILRGIGTGICLHSMLSAIQERVPQEKVAQASTIISVFRMVIGTISLSLIYLITVTRQVYHTTRFAEQVDIYSGRFKQYIREFQLYGEKKASQNWEEAASRAKRYVIENLYTQAHIAAMNDALYIFAWVCVILVILMGLNEWVISAKKETYLEHKFD
jgi:predicted MFS family arabinose efflux permease